jgi:hypothetical protein
VPVKQVGCDRPERMLEKFEQSTGATHHPIWQWLESRNFRNSTEYPKQNFVRSCNIAAFSLKRKFSFIQVNIPAILNFSSYTHY